MPTYINPNPYTVNLAGPDGRILKLHSNQTITLTDYYDRYRSRGFIQLVTDNTPRAPQRNIQVRIQNRDINQSIARARKPNVKPKEEPKPKMRAQTKQIARMATKREEKKEGRKLVVGKQIRQDAAELLRKNISQDSYPISNNIAVGILSYNRKLSLERLLSSILKYTDLRRTTVFISDDNSTDPAICEYLQLLKLNPNLVVIENNQNLGVAGNTNRLLRCLKRFKYSLLLNDDVEVLKAGWDEFYKTGHEKTDLHHFCFRQPGVYGAKLGDLVSKKGLDLRVVNDKPHGAILSFTNHMLDKCGYFNTEYGKYGMEHVDWSMKAYEMDLQPTGFYDIEGSQDYFKVHSDQTKTENKGIHLNNARRIFENRKPIRLEPDKNSKVPAITYVVPFRDHDRSDSIKTVINGIRAQKFPEIEIIAVEQDAQTRISVQDLEPITYFLAKETENILFNKSKAFNLGVSKSSHDKIVLHDADMVANGSYTSKLSNILDSFDACHIGKTVIYSSQASTNIINSTGIIDESALCERIVGYYEGGSLACLKSTYWAVGGFNEDFWGYGVEDCEFFDRLSRNSKWYDVREADLFHLWHTRVSDWNKHHDNNKVLGEHLYATPMDKRLEDQIKQVKEAGYF